MVISHRYSLFENADGRDFITFIKHCAIFWGEQFTEFMPGQVMLVILPLC